MRDPGEASAAALELARVLGLSFTAADVLHRRGFAAGDGTERFLDPRLTHLTSPDGMADREAAGDRLVRAIRAREPIAVFGDYDCDGITSCAIVTESLRALGGEVTPLCASRFAGGYGFSATALGRVKASGATLLVTCDCGSADHERLAAAKSAGIDAVVIDHHLVPDEALPAVAFLNPHRPECRFPYKGLASCGLALSLAAELRKQLGAKLDVRQWLDLVAIGTIADVAPLDGDNRVLVRRGLERLAAGERPGLAALLQNAFRGKSRTPSAEDVAFQVAPRINAAGRLGDPEIALRLLLERDHGRAEDLAAELERLSSERRALQRTLVAEALSEIGEHGYASDPGIVLARQGWHVGIVGIVAGRIASLYRKPTVVVALEGLSGRGSVRGPAGFRLYDALCRCERELVGFGGHQAAAGLELAADRVERFRDAWRAACAEAAPVASDGEAGAADVRLDSRDDIGQVLGDLERIEPCGEKNPAPELYLAGAEVKNSRPIGAHLKLELQVGQRTVSAFWPDMAHVEARGRIDLVGKLKRDWWRGGDAVELLVTTLRWGAGAPAQKDR